MAVDVGTNATAENEAILREQLGLNDPLYVQYFRYVGDACVGDLGTSIRSGQPVLSEITERVGSTVQLTFVAMAIAVTLGVTLGVLAATSGRRTTDAGIMTLALIGISMPTFWTGIC